MKELKSKFVFERADKSSRHRLQHNYAQILPVDQIDTVFHAKLLITNQSGSRAAPSLGQKIHYRANIFKKRIG